MSQFTDWQAQRRASETPLDITGETPEGKRPYTTFAEWKAAKDKQPTIDATEIPQPAPTEAPSGAPAEPVEEEEEGLPFVPQLYSDPELPMMPFGLGSPDALAAQTEQVKQMIKDKEAEVGAKNLLASKEFARNEGLPMVGSMVGTALMPFTAGTSLPVALALTATGSGLGAMVGEAAEQVFKKAEMIDYGIGEEAPRDGWDMWNRTLVEGGEAAAWSLVPDILLRGMPMLKRKILTLGAKPTVTVEGEVVDVVRKNMVELMEDYAAKKGLQEGEVLLASDVAHVPLFEMAEDVTRNSYIGGAKATAVRETQAEALQEAIGETVETFLTPAKGYVSETSNAALAKYIEPNMDTLNSFAVAGLINTGFNRAQEAQKSVARSIYGTIGDLMERTKMQKVVKEMEMPFLKNGKPVYRMVEVLEETPAFPVNLRGLTEFAESHLDDTLFTADDILTDLIGLPPTATYKQAANTLSELRARARKLKASTDEFAPRRLRIVTQAMEELEPALESAMKAAEEAGIKGAGGESLTALKSQADAIWKEQVEDFQNSYIANILKKADMVNGAPDKLGAMFMQNEMAAAKISKILKDSKGTLTGDALRNIEAAENAIKGSIVQDIFMPVDAIGGKFTVPNTATVKAKADTLKRIFSEEEYEGLVKLANAIEAQSGRATSNYLGFAQRARESGMVMSTLKSLTKADFGPLIRDGGSTVMFALGMGRILTNPKNIKLAAKLADNTIPSGVRIQIMQQLVHRTYDYQKAQNDALTEDQMERLQAAHDDREEARRMQQGQ